MLFLVKVDGSNGDPQELLDIQRTDALPRFQSLLSLDSVEVWLLIKHVLKLIHQSLAHDNLSDRWQEKIYLSFRLQLETHCLEVIRRHLKLV